MYLVSFLILVINKLKIKKNFIVGFFLIIKVEKNVIFENLSIDEY